MKRAAGTVWNRHLGRNSVKEDLPWAVFTGDKKYGVKRAKGVSEHRDVTYL